MPSFLSVPIDPDDIDDFTWDWQRCLGGSETISAVEVTVTEGAATLGIPSVDGPRTTVRVSAAAPGPLALRARMTTSTGRRRGHTITVLVQEQ